MTEETPSLGKEIRSGTQWTFTGSLITEILQFGVSIALARILMPADFGLISTVGVLTGLAGYFAGAGTSQALIRATHIDQRHINTVFTLQLLIGSIIYLLFVIVAPFFADFFEQPIYQSLLLVSGLSFFLRPFANLPSALLQREMRFRPMVIINVVTLTAGSSLSIVLAVTGQGVWSLLFGGLFGSLLRAIILSIHVRQRFSLAWEKDIIKEMGGYGIKVATNSLIEHFRNQSLILILSKFNGPAEVGLYNRGASLAQMPMKIVGTSPYQAVFRALASEQDNLDKSRYIYYRTITLVAVYTLPLYVFAWWLAEPGVRFIYGDKWLASAEPLAILATTGIFRCIGNPSGAVIEARNRIATEIKLNIIAWLILIVGLIYGLQWGIMGAAWATVVMMVFFNISLAVLAGHELRGSLRALLKAILPGVLLSSLMLVAIWVADASFLSHYYLASPGLYSMLISAIGGVVYVTAFLFLPIPAITTEAAKWRSKLRLNKPNPA